MLLISANKFGVDCILKDSATYTDWFQVITYMHLYHNTVKFLNLIGEKGLINFP